MKKMEELKFKYRPFEGEADVWTEETYDTALLCVCRKSGNEMERVSLTSAMKTARPGSIWVSSPGRICLPARNVFCAAFRFRHAVTHGITGNGIKSLAKERKV